MNWYLKAFQKYLDFDGRATRSEYWMFVLFNAIFTIVAIVLDYKLGLLEKYPYGLLFLIYSIIVFIPNLGVTVRRLHDINKSGWVIFLSVIPLIGSIWLLVLLSLDGDRDENEYGKSLKVCLNDDHCNEKSNNEILILFAFFWILAFSFFESIILKIIRILYLSDEWLRLIYSYMGLIWGAIPIMLAYSIKDKSLRVILIVIGGLYFLYRLYEILTPVITKFYGD